MLEDEGERRAWVWRGKEGVVRVRKRKKKKGGESDRRLKKLGRTLNDQVPDG